MILEKSILQGIENHKYLVKIAESESEVNEALKLRYRVFSGELNRQFDFSDKLDYDNYDDQCHHLLVIEKETDSVIGTYRLQTYTQAKAANGFVTAKRFTLEDLSEEVLKLSFEVGRVCIHPDYRNGRVLFLLWKGLASYLKFFELRYLFGYSALEADSDSIAHNTYQYLLKNHFVNNKYKIEVRENYKIKRLNGSTNIKEVYMPPLLKNYLDVGTKICSEPAYDQDSDIYHFFILLDVNEISDRTRKMFFGS